MNSELITIDKQKLRKKFLELRLKLDEKTKKQKDKKILKNLISLDEFKKAKNVMIYYPFKNEVNVLELIKIFKDKNFFFPVVNFKKKVLEIRRYNDGKFVKNKFGIFEPKGKSLKKIKLDFIVVPGIVFDEKCFRIGFGGGYYDKFLKNVDCFACGVCYDFQIVKSLPVEKNDVKLDCVFSEKRVMISR